MFKMQAKIKIIVPPRYHLLVRVKPSDQLDMADLKEKSMRRFWLSGILYVVTGQIPWVVMLLHRGWPWVGIFQMSPEVFFLMGLAANVASNLPDAASIVVYLGMMWHFWRGRRKAAVQPDESISEISEEPYGGIWVGGNGENSLDISKDDLDDSSSNSNNIGNNNNNVGHNVGIGNNSSSSSNDNNNNSPGHDVSSVMKALRFHVLFCATDLATFFATLVLCSPFAGVGKAALYGHGLVSSFWVPLLVVRKSVRQLG